MPKVKIKGKVKHFPYTKTGKAAAKKERMMMSQSQMRRRAAMKGQKMSIV